MDVDSFNKLSGFEAYLQEYWMACVICNWRMSECEKTTHTFAMKTKGAVAVEKAQMDFLFTQELFTQQETQQAGLETEKMSVYEKSM